MHWYMSLLPYLKNIDLLLKKYRNINYEFLIKRVMGTLRFTIFTIYFVFEYIVKCVNSY